MSPGTVGAHAVFSSPRYRRVSSQWPIIVRHHVGQWCNHRFDHLWGMLSLDMWRADLLSTKSNTTGGTPVHVPAHAIATLRLHFQGDKRCTVFELTAQPDGSLANERLRLVILEANITEQRLGGWFVFTGDCPQACTYANYFQMTPDSMLHNLED